jgi:hypothetical protein
MIWHGKVNRNRSSTATRRSRRYFHGGRIRKLPDHSEDALGAAWRHGYTGSISSGPFVRIRMKDPVAIASSLMLGDGMCYGCGSFASAES